MAETPTIEPGVPDHRGRPGMLLRAPYSEGLVEDLKDEILTNSRHWDAVRSAWWIGEPYRETAVEIALRHHSSVLVIGAPGEEDELISRDGSRVSQARLF